MHKNLPLVTIGLPTFNRPELLGRALSCVSRQRYPNLQVIVADNCTPGNEVDKIVDRFRQEIKNIVFVKHDRNIGPHQNFSFLLRMAQGKYFMWLADDDEISDNYLESLVPLLEEDIEIVTAAGNWYWMRSQDAGDLMPRREYKSMRTGVRLSQYLWKADDAFFYGLHRTEILRKASFPGYSWPNGKTIMNWAYVYLLDMVLRGKVVVHSNPSVRFINHDYSVKNYIASEAGVAGVLKHVMRRMNVHALYLGKIRRSHGLLFAVPLAFISLSSLLREGASSVAIRAKGKFSSLSRTTV